MTDDLVVIPLLRTVSLPGEALASAPGIPAAVTFGGAAAGERIPHAG